MLHSKTLLPDHRESIWANGHRYGGARKELAQWLNEGKIQRKETVIKGGLKIADKALTELYNGVNTGK